MNSLQYTFTNKKCGSGFTFFLNFMFTSKVSYYGVWMGSWEKLALYRNDGDLALLFKQESRLHTETDWKSRCSASKSEQDNSDAWIRNIWYTQSAFQVWNNALFIFGYNDVLMN